MILKLKLFPVGVHTDSSGVTREFTADMLANAAAVYDVGVHEAPIVELHDDGPGAFRHGGVAKLEFDGETLIPHVNQLSYPLLNGVNDGSVRYFSASFYLPDNPNNPVPGSLYLRHVGIVPIPAVKGQPEPELVYSESKQTLTMNFMEADVMSDPVSPARQAKKEVAEFLEANAESLAKKQAAFEESHRQREAEFAEREKRLAEKEAEIRRAKIAQFCGSLAASGKLLPRDTPTVVGILDYLEQAPAAVTVSFAEPGAEGETAKKDGTLAEAFKSFLANQPKAVEYGEITKPDGNAAGGQDAEMKRMAENIAKGANS
jgi:hypothetical protein